MVSGSLNRLPELFACFRIGIHPYFPACENTAMLAAKALRFNTIR
jgi:hypothetical protein